MSTSQKRQRQGQRYRAELPDPFVPALRGLLLATLAVNAVLLTRAPLDFFSLPRATVIAVAAVLALALAVMNFVATGRLSLPPVPVLLLLGAFTAALCVAVAVSEHPMRSVVGPYTRYTGLFLYLPLVILMLGVVRSFDADRSRSIGWVMVASLGVVVAYGLVQQLGLDPIDWGVPPESEVFEFHHERTDFSTLGNINFSAAFVGISAPFALWVALNRNHQSPVRLTAVGIFLGAGVYLLVNGSFQGPVTILAGSTFVLTVWLAESRDRWRALTSRTRQLAIGGVAAALLALAAASPVLIPLAAEELREGEERVQFWETAVEIWQESPIWGKGLGGFSWEFTQRRQVEHGAARMFQGADSPHNVVIELLTGGGLLLATSYIAVVAYTGSVLARGLLRLSGERRLFLAALGGGWVAYHLQSLVSIDVPPLALLHWVIAGAIVVVASPSGLTSLQVFEPVAGQSGRRRQRHRGRQRDRSLLAAQTAVGAVVVLALVPVSRPLRADLAAGAAGRSQAAGDLTLMLQHADRAVALAPWEDTYWAQRAAALDNLGRLEEAKEAGERAAREGPGNAFYALAVAGLAERLEQPDEATEWLEVALLRDPHNPRVIEALAGFALHRGQPEEAIPLLERAVEIAPRRAESWALLAEAYEMLGQSRDADEARDRAVELDPEIVDR